MYSPNWEPPRHTNTILGMVGCTTLNWWTDPFTQRKRCYLWLYRVKTHVHLKIVVEFMVIKNYWKYWRTPNTLSTEKPKFGWVQRSNPQNSVLTHAIRIWGNWISILRSMKMSFKKFNFIYKNFDKRRLNSTLLIFYNYSIPINYFVSDCNKIRYNKLIEE